MVGDGVVHGVMMRRFVSVHVLMVHESQESLALFGVLLLSCQMYIYMDHNTDCCTH